MERDATILVTGGTGLVGSAIVRILRAKGYSNVLAPARGMLDLMNVQAVREYFAAQRPAYAVLAAARVGGIAANMAHPAEFLHQNIVMQENVMWAAHQQGVRKLMFLGSNCIYPRECPQPMREEYIMTGPVEPTNEAYAIAKIAGVKLAEKIYEQYGTPFISCLPCNIYGDRDHFETERGHVIPGMLRRMHDAKRSGAPEFVIWGTGTPRREFMHADDLAEGVEFLMRVYTENRFVNIGSGEDITVGELAALIKEIVGYKGKLVFDTSKPDGMPRKLLEVSRIRALGWAPRVSLRDGIERVYRWFLENQ